MSYVPSAYVHVRLCVHIDCSLVRYTQYRARAQYVSDMSARMHIGNRDIGTEEQVDEDGVVRRTGQEEEADVDGAGGG